MKTVIVSMLFLLIATEGRSQSDRYTVAMRNNLAGIDSGFKNPAYLLNLSNNFERIGAAEKSQWLPYYYAAFLRVNYGFMETDKSKTDAIADKAEQLIRIADSLSAGNSEISTVKSMIASCRLMVDPMRRYMEYGPVSEAAINAAITQDPSNPRPYLLRGQALKYTPEQFGGGCKKASVPLQIAINKFAEFHPVSELYPGWGESMTRDLLESCK